VEKFWNYDKSWETSWWADSEITCVMAISCPFRNRDCCTARSTAVYNRGMGPIRLAIFAVFALVGSAAAQTKPSPAAQTYKNAGIGLTYTFPATLAPQPENELPQSSGTEKIILALWDKPRHTPVPRVVFLYDSKVQPARFTPDEIALKYLQSLRPQAGYKMSNPQKVRIGANALWRMDYWRPDDSGQSYNSAIAFAFKNRTVLCIQMDASSQPELDSLVDSLQALIFDRQ